MCEGDLPSAQRRFRPPIRVASQRSSAAASRLDRGQHPIGNERLADGVQLAAVCCLTRPIRDGALISGDAGG